MGKPGLSCNVESIQVIHGQRYVRLISRRICIFRVRKDASVQEAEGSQVIHYMTDSETATLELVRCLVRRLCV